MTLLILAGAVCFCIFMALCMDNMIDFKLSNKRDWLFTIFTLVIIGSMALISDIFQLDEHVELYLSGLFMIILLSALYRSVFKVATLTVYIIAFLFGLESVVLLSLRFLNNTVNYIPNPDFIVNAISALCIVALSFVLKNYLKKRIDMNILNNRTMHFMLASAGAALIFIYINIAAEAPYINLGLWIIDFSDMAYMLFLLSSVIMFIIILRYISKETAIRTEMLLVESSKKYIHDLEESYKALRTIKHDYVNILTSLKLYIDNGDIEGLSKYYYNELSDINKELLHQDKLISSLQNVRLSEVKSILIYKCSMAAQHKIKTNIEVIEPLESLGVSTAIVCQILGILLDNAIEAILDSMALEIKEKKLHIAIIKNNNSKTFIIKNAWQKQDIPTNKLFDLGFSTKNNSRGVGLYTVRNYTDKIKNLYLETELDDEYFTQILTVKDH